MPSEHPLSIAIEMPTDKSTMLDIAQLFISLVSPILAVFLAVQLSLRKFYSQKWWEKKSEVYSNILESLAQMEGSTKHSFYSDVVGLPSTEEQDQAKAKFYRESSDRIEKITNMGAFIISKSAHEHLAILSHKLEGSKGKADWANAIDDNWGAIREAIQEIRKCAEQDLKLDSWWKFWKV